MNVAHQNTLLSVWCNNKKFLTKIIDLHAHLFQVIDSALIIALAVSFFITSSIIYKDNNSLQIFKN